MPERWPAAMLLRTAAEYLDCSPDTVDRLLKSKELSCIQLAGRGDRRIRKEALDAYLEKLEQERIRVS